MTQNGSILAVDLGGTRIRVARLNRALDVEARVEDWTRPERGPDDAIDRMVEMLQSLWPQSHAGVDVGIAAPGPRPTLWAAWFFATHFALPVLAVCGVLDVLVYLAGRGGDGPCLSQLCWLGY